MILKSHIRWCYISGAGIGYSSLYRTIVSKFNQTTVTNHIICCLNIHYPCKISFILMQQRGLFSGYLILNFITISEIFLFPINLRVWERRNWRYTQSWHTKTGFTVCVNGNPQTVNTEMWVVIITCDIKHGISIEQVYKISEAVL